MSSPAIETRSLSVSFGAVPGLRDLDLDVHRGEVFGFLGPNGAGKTTTIRLLLDLLRPDHGQVRLLGEEAAAGGGELRRNVGFLPGDLALFPSISGTETLRLFAGLVGRDPVLRDEVLDRLGFVPRDLGRKIRTYSTGMRQKIGITCAFQHDPELLILDEPTTGLDPIVRDAFLELVRDRREAGRTVFLSSHVLDEIERSADRVGFITGARLRLVDTVENVRRNRPRTVVLTYAGGRKESFTHQGDPKGLVSKLDANGLVDIEVRPSSLDDVFRAVIGEHAP